MMQRNGGANLQAIIALTAGGTSFSLRFSHQLVWTAAVLLTTLLHALAFWTTYACGTAVNVVRPRTSHPAPGSNPGPSTPRRSPASLEVLGFIGFWTENGVVKPIVLPAVARGAPAHHLGLGSRTAYRRQYRRHNYHIFSQLPY